METWFWSYLCPPPPTMSGVWYYLCFLTKAQTDQYFFFYNISRNLLQNFSITKKPGHVLLKAKLRNDEHCSLSSPHTYTFLYHIFLLLFNVFPQYFESGFVVFHYCFPNALLLANDLSPHHTQERGRHEINKQTDRHI